jgi:hypothetical protein
MTDASDNPSLMDGGANICVTGILGLLVDVLSIPPTPILVATTLGSISIDDCCTKRGLIPLTLSNGSIYYQPCYYCKNAVEMIISPEAIVAASDTLVHWTQEGHKGSGPGHIRFSSKSGLYSITLNLEKRDGLYYCPTDAFTIDHDPTCPATPIIKRAVAPPQLDIPRLSKRYLPVPRDRMAESELWMQRLGCPGEDQLDLLPGNSVAYHITSNTTHSVSSTGRNWSESRNRPHCVLPNGLRKSSGAFILILASCAHQLLTSIDLTKHKIG